MKLLPLIASIKLIIAYSRGWFICFIPSIFKRCKVLIIVPYNHLGILLLSMVIMSFCAGSLFSEKFQHDRAHTASPEPEISAPSPPPPFYPTFDADTGRPAPPTVTNMNEMIEHNELIPVAGSSEHPDTGSFNLPSPPEDPSQSASPKPKRRVRRTTPQERHTMMVLAQNGKAPVAIANYLGLNRNTVAGWIRAQKKKGLITPAKPGGSSTADRKRSNDSS